MQAPSLTCLDMNDQISAEEQIIVEARERGTGETLKAFTRLSGPGWLQSAITLGGGSLASALYLGVLSGYRFLWLQIVAMLLGIVMLSAIAYVTLSTGKRPFRAIRDHVNPVLAWGWILAVMLANLVWALPQFALGSAAVQQNLVPSLEGTGGTIITCTLILALATAAIFSYGSGARGVRIFEWLLRGMVGLVVVCFFGVVATLALSEAGLPWGTIFSGLVPDLSYLSKPVDGFAEVLSGSAYSDWWSERIVKKQHDVMIAAAATAVGINMTFLLPYSMLRKGWNQNFRGLAVFDLLTGLLIPFALATSCVVIASASQFHARYDVDLVTDPAVAATNDGYLKNLEDRLVAGDGELSVAPALREELGDEAFLARVTEAFEVLPEADLQLAGMLLTRDAFHLADALEPLAGSTVSQVVFGIGVLGMAISTVIILMLISGFTFCEMFGREASGWPFRIGALAAGIFGFFGPFIFQGNVKFWLAVPTSNFGMVLLPIAYWTFFIMMNSRSLLGDALPRGRARLIWNTLMLLSAGVATFACLATIEGREPAIREWAYKGLGSFLTLVAVVGVLRRRGT